MQQENYCILYCSNALSKVKLRAASLIVCAFVWGCLHVCACASISQRSLDLRCLLHQSLLILEPVSARDLPVCFLRPRIIDACQNSWILCGFWGTKCRSSFWVTITSCTELSPSPGAPSLDDSYSVPLCTNHTSTVITMNYLFMIIWFEFSTISVSYLKKSQLNSSNLTTL